MLEMVMKGLVDIGDMGEQDSMSSYREVQSCSGAVGCTLCRTGAIEGVGVDGGVWLSEDSAVTWTSVVTVP